jgi:hypothetical protein
MLTREGLEAVFSLKPPASDANIEKCSQALGAPIPVDYAAFLGISNGLVSQGCLTLLEVEELAQRNAIYEVQDYLPHHVMIGDDSGGIALVMKYGDRAVYEVGMGTLDEETKAISATSLEEFLLVYEGKTLSER